MDVRKKSFLTLKNMFTKELILAMFNFVKKIIVEMDASKIVLNAILS